MRAFGCWAAGIDGARTTVEFKSLPEIELLGAIAAVEKERERGKKDKTAVNVDFEALDVRGVVSRVCLAGLYAYAYAYAYACANPYV